MKMREFWEWFASMFYAYGKLGAGMVSFHGGYEGEVPAALQKVQK